jgi:hypothetical protein
MTPTVDSPRKHISTFEGEEVHRSCHSEDRDEPIDEPSFYPIDRSALVHRVLVRMFACFVVSINFYASIHIQCLTIRIYILLIINFLILYILIHLFYCSISRMMCTGSSSPNQNECKNSCSLCFVFYGRDPL